MVSHQPGLSFRDSAVLKGPQAQMVYHQCDLSFRDSTVLKGNPSTDGLSPIWSFTQGFHSIKGDPKNRCKLAWKCRNCTNIHLLSSYSCSINIYATDWLFCYCECEPRWAFLLWMWAPHGHVGSLFTTWQQEKDWFMMLYTCTTHGSLVHDVRHTLPARHKMAALMAMLLQLSNINC